MSIRKKMYGFAAVLIFASSLLAHAAPRVTVDLLESPITTPISRFDNFILSQASGDSKRAAIMKEQWMGMYNSLNPTAQGAIYGSLATADERQFLKIMQSDLPTALAKQIQGLLSSTMTADGQKLAPTDNEYVFVPTAPCRVSDTRLWSAGGLLPYKVRQIYAWSAVSGYNYSEQGGTGTAGSGDCSATVFASTSPPIAALVTVVAIAGPSPGNFRAWNGGAPMTAASMINFVPGNVIANTTLIPLDRSVAAYSPSDNTKRDFAIYNESASTVQVIADVVGYFVKPALYSLACSNFDATPISNSTTTGFKSVSAPACPTGTSRTGVLCALTGTSGANLQSTGYGSSPACEWTQTSTISNGFNARSICCTLP